MSAYKDDWKLFSQLSDKMVIRDMTNPDSHEKVLLGDVKKGLWAAFVIYREDLTEIKRIVVGSYETLQKTVDSKNGLYKSRKIPFPVYRRTDRFKMENGVISIFDESFDDKWPESLDESMVRLNEQLKDIWGNPHEEGKSDKQQFFELACHMAQPDNTPSIGSAKYGTFAKLNGEEAEIIVLRSQDDYEVVALEIIPK